MTLSDDRQLSVVQEALRVEKRLRERRVVIHITSEEQDVPVEADLSDEQITVDRIAVSRSVDAPEDPRQEGDVLIVPLHEEQLLVHKQLVVVAELHIRRTGRQVHEKRTVKVHKERVSVAREPLPGRPGGATVETTDSERQRHPRGDEEQ